MTVQVFWDPQDTSHLSHLDELFSFQIMAERVLMLKMVYWCSFTIIYYVSTGTIIYSTQTIWMLSILGFRPLTLRVQAYTPHELRMTSRLSGSNIRLVGGRTGTAIPSQISLTPHLSSVYRWPNGHRIPTGTSTQGARTLTGQWPILSV